MWMLLSAAAFADPPADLSVATLNTWGLPAPVADDRRGRLPRIASWLTEKSYDVAGLEELWQGARRWFPMRDLLFPEQRGDSGLAIVTSWPVTESRSHVFRAERGFDSWKAKGMLVAELEVDGSPIVFGVTHLQAGGSDRNAAIRSAQISEILSWLQKERDAPVILLGDFNLYDDVATDDHSRQILEREGFLDVAHATGTLEGTYQGYPDRFDRIYVRDGESATIVPESSAVLGKGLSDHHALEATLKVEPR